MGMMTMTTHAPEVNLVMAKIIITIKVSVAPTPLMIMCCRQLGSYSRSASMPFIVSPGLRRPILRK